MYVVTSGFMLDRIEDSCLKLYEDKSERTSM